MTQDQVMGLLRQLLPIIGTVVTAFGVTATEWNAWSNIILSAVGPIMIIGGFVWSLLANSKYSIIKSATEMPEVDSKKLMSAIDDTDLKEAARPTPKDKS